MLKNFIIFIAFICICNFVFSEEVFSLKKNYDISVFVEGNDQLSIKEGMQKGLSSLLVNLSGSSKILNHKSIINMMGSPEKYVSQYKLELDENKLKANFIYEGNIIRAFLSENELPLWLAKTPLILSFLPCLENIEIIKSKEEQILCKNLQVELNDLSIKRKSLISRPLMDLVDINYLESLIAISPKSFMAKISKRYDVDPWLICFIKDEFGILLEVPMCRSSTEEEFFSLKITFNSLLDQVNQEKSIVVNRDIRNESFIRIMNVNDFNDLEEIIKGLKSQILVYDVSLMLIEGETIEISLFHFGSKKDLENLMSIHNDFKEITNSSQAIISYEYNKS